MSRSCNPLSALMAWSHFGQAYVRMAMSAGEVIVRRTMAMASGTMTSHEAMAMIMEKPTAFATAAEKAAVAAVRGRDAARIASAALRPFGVKTRSNALRLRK